MDKVFQEIINLIDNTVFIEGNFKKFQKLF